MTTPPLESAWAKLLFDARLAPSDGRTQAEEAERVVTEYVEALQGDTGNLSGPLVVPDTDLGRIDRIVSGLGVGPLEVCVVSTTGAGGLVALADRSYENLTVVAAHSVLRDLDDPAGNAQRVAAAARGLGDEVTVYTGLPDAPGWESAAETVEMEGLAAAVSAPGALGVTQMSFLVELDCPFVVSDTTAAPVDVAATVLALVEQTAPVPGWPGADEAPRVRRRLHGIWTV
ncbi:MAG TPA: hypothetical protein IAA98_15445 [Candidatus Avipropionibacterium avicola]|uniref:Uncharacterized protein n=1 Tax=Candidatus Avipropionibacterium avicola TaxID=2840701 RepID=A0A9D1H0K0_9ACTN|nr:hypothetical protein [Candidatus Avipropionibacterium avicola]